jgi:hypothetical protein
VPDAGILADAESTTDSHGAASLARANLPEVAHLPA